MHSFEVSTKTEAALGRAAFEATALGHAIQGPEHILLALVSKDDSPCFTLLKNLGVTYNRVRPMVQAMHPSSTKVRVVEQFNSAATKVVKDAIIIAQRQSRDVAQPIHLLTALIASNDINVMQIMHGLYADTDTLLAVLQQS
jgi:ATP-dependent Clp protease ATP-binding subunit ClpA